MKRSLPFFFSLLMALPMWASQPVCVSNRAVEGASGTMVIKQKHKAKSRIPAPKGYKIPATKGYKIPAPRVTNWCGTMSLAVLHLAKIGCMS